jgi:hypothetical protein
LTTACPNTADYIGSSEDAHPACLASPESIPATRPGGCVLFPDASPLAEEPSRIDKYLNSGSRGIINRAGQSSGLAPQPLLVNC